MYSTHSIDDTLTILKSYVILIHQIMKLISLWIFLFINSWKF